MQDIGKQKTSNPCSIVYPLFASCFAAELRPGVDSSSEREEGEGGRMGYLGSFVQHRQRRWLLRLEDSERLQEGEY